MQVIMVEGNIGAGKSEFLKAMQAVCECSIVPEPVPHKFLDCLYADPANWAYPFQLIMATERKIAQNKALEMEARGDLVFLERSLYADSLFAKVAIQDPEEFKKYEVFRNEILGGIIAVPDLIVYLRSTPEGCLSRIKDRMGLDPMRECEGVVSLEYLQKLHDEHEKWLIENRDYSVVTYNTETTDWRNPALAGDIFRYIRDYVEFGKEFKREFNEYFDKPMEATP